MPTCYLAPDWGMALRISGELDAEFGGDNVMVVGPWRQENVHGTIFAVCSARFPTEWHERLLDLKEIPWEKGYAGKLDLHPDAERERVVKGEVKNRIVRNLIKELQEGTYP